MLPRASLRKIRLPAGSAAQTRRTLEAMRRVARAAAFTPLVHEYAVAIAHGTDGRDQHGLALALRDWLQLHISFLADPVIAGTELLRAPDYLLDQVNRYGVARGDCDDVSTLAAALAAAVGLRSRFVALGWSGVYLHVFAEVLVPQRGWLEMDVTEPVHRRRHDATHTITLEVI